MQKGMEMGLTLKRRNGVLLAILALAMVAAYQPVTNLLLATRLMLAVRSLASGSTGQGLLVEESKVLRKMGDRDLEALLYRPSESFPRRAVVLIAGVSELGCYHPRLMALARTMADKGFLVLTPDIQMFRRFQVSSEAMDEISFWYGQISSLAGGRKIKRVGLVGISFSGTLALIVATRPDIRDSVAFVMGIGPYQDLLRCSRAWFAPGPVTVSEGYYPTRFYGKWIIMLAALDMLPMEEDRKFLREALWKLLLQGSAPPALQNLSPEAQQWLRLAAMREDETDPQLTQAIENHLAPLYRQLSPEQAAAEVRCPVFLAHGAYDDLIPPTESQELQKRIRQADSYLLISPFLTHTHPLEKEWSWIQKGEAVWNMLGFFYSLAQAAG